jgi:thiamine monophosphate kinase
LDGEDFELLFATDSAEADDLLAQQPFSCGLSRLATFEAGSGVFGMNSQGQPTPLARDGYIHGS